MFEKGIKDIRVLQRTGNKAIEVNMVSRLFDHLQIKEKGRLTMKFLGSVRAWQGDKSDWKMILFRGV